MIKLHIKEWKKALKYVRHKKLKHLYLEIIDKHGKQCFSDDIPMGTHQYKRVSKKWCCFCARNGSLAVPIAEEMTFEHGFGNCDCGDI